VSGRRRSLLFLTTHDSRLLSLPALLLHRHHKFQNFSFYQIPTIIAKMSSGPYNTRSSARATPVGDTNPAASANTQLTSEASSSATAAPLGPTVAPGTAAAAIDPALQAVITTLGTDGSRALLLKAIAPNASRYCAARR
jgi:hypothetical protein